jgi:hypothetical protein
MTVYAQCQAARRARTPQGQFDDDHASGAYADKTMHDCHIDLHKLLLVIARLINFIRVSVFVLVRIVHSDSTGNVLQCKDCRIEREASESTLASIALLAYFHLFLVYVYMV